MAHMAFAVLAWKLRHYARGFNYRWWQPNVLYDTNFRSQTIVRYDVNYVKNYNYCVALNVVIEIFIYTRIQIAIILLLILQSSSTQEDWVTLLSDRVICIFIYRITSEIISANIHICVPSLYFVRRKSTRCNRIKKKKKKRSKQEKIVKYERVELRKQI